MINATATALPCEICAKGAAVTTLARNFPRILICRECANIFNTRIVARSNKGNLKGTLLGKVKL